MLADASPKHYCSGNDAKHGIWAKDKNHRKCGLVGGRRRLSLARQLRQDV